MSWRRIPVVPTLVVLAAVAVMVRLGFWQIDRLHQKEALQARYEAARGMDTGLAWPTAESSLEAMLYRKTSVVCRTSGPDQPMAGHNATGETGWAHVLPCGLEQGVQAEVVLGWSLDPKPVTWAGGAVSGTLVKGKQTLARVVADPPLAGLQANARPDPRDIANNHFAYAVQWFLFALTALVIYAIALRKRLRGG